MTCVFAVCAAVPCLSSKVAQSMWMLGLCVRWISQARLKTARASSTLCDSRYWAYWIQDHKIHAFRCGCMNSKMSKLSCHTNKPFLLWSRTPHTERRLSGSAQRGCAPCGHLEQLRLLLIPPEVGLWPLTLPWLPHLDLRGNNRKYKDFHIFYTHFKPLTERSLNIYKTQHLVWLLWCPCSAEISPSPDRNAMHAAGGGRVASHGSMDVWSADQTITCMFCQELKLHFYKYKTWIPPFVVSCKAKHWELKFFFRDGFKLNLNIVFSSLPLTQSLKITENSQRLQSSICCGLLPRCPDTLCPCGVRPVLWSSALIPPKTRNQKMPLNALSVLRTLEHVSELSVMQLH